MSRTEPLNLDRLRESLTTACFGRTLRYVPQTDSTNADALRHVQQIKGQPVPHGMVILAESQRAGRGRRGRSWHSPAEGNIYCSLILAPRTGTGMPLHALSWTPLASALAAADALARQGNLPVVVKWPNDVLIREKKVGGILCEQTNTADKQSAVIVGIGLNINSDPADLPEDLRATATSVSAELHRPVDRVQILADLLLGLEERLERLWQEGPGVLATEFSRRCDTLGKHVRITFSRQETVEGKALSIGDDGHLRVAVASTGIDDQDPRIIEVRSADVVHLRG